MASTGTAIETSEFRLVYLGGLPKRISETDLLNLCLPFGTVVRVQIERDPHTGAQLGFGFVQFADAAQAASASKTLHGRRYQGVILTARQISGEIGAG